ncbi:long-chain fatty acid--CoA ligase [Treponema primitia]|uniref:AMP-dependent synthetase/ligase n=1 Tax=Treponema primitia TaxID=88058 RepID=UPI003980709E
MEQTLPLMLRKRVRTIPSVVAQYAKDAAGHFQPKTYQQFYNEILYTASGLLELGTKRGDHIGIISDNRQEWIVTDFAILSIGAADVPRGCDSMEQEITYILGFTECPLCFVENQKQISKIIARRADLPLLSIIVSYNHVDQHILEAARDAGIRVLEFGGLLELGKGRCSLNPGEIETEMEKGRKEDLATIIFTSGTTGEPKGVMLSHDNFLVQQPSWRLVFEVKTGDIWLSVLPVWHVFERSMEYIIFYLNSGIAYSKPVSSVLLADFQNIRPHWMVSVPRVWESIMDWSNRHVKKQGWIFKNGFEFFMTVGIMYNYFRDLTFGRIPNFHGRVRLFDFFMGIIPLILLCPIQCLTALIVFRPIKKRLGGRFKAGLSGGGALPLKVDLFFNAIGIRLQEGYGLTEAAPIVAARRYKAPRCTTVGQLLLNTEARIVDDTGTILPPGHNGHLQVRGGQVMQGYYRKPELTAKVLSPDGWLETGDIAMMTYDNEVRITGRAKDTIVLLGGENVEPVPIENKIRESSWVSHCIVVGQNQKYIAALVVPVQEALMSFAEENNIPIVDYESLLQQAEINELISNEVSRLVSAQAGFKTYERVFKLKLIPKPFEVGEELTGKMELQRAKITAKYGKEIGSLFKN